MKLENIFAALVVVGIFTVILFAAKISMGFQKACDDLCAPQAAITPVVGGEEVCFCNEGQGMWRKVDARSH